MKRIYYLMGDDSDSALFSCPLTGCGFPGIPLNGVITFTVSGKVSRYEYSQIAFNESIRNGFWPVETLVNYECETQGRFVMIGGIWRICLDNGTWGGHLSFCDENVAYGREVFVNNMTSSDSKNQNTTFLTDGIVALETFKRINLRGKSDERIILEFQSPVNVRSVIIHGNCGENWQENCQNSTVLRNREVETRCSATSTINNSIQISCPDDGILSRKITFFHLSKAKCFIVEIQVFVRPKNSCGFPEVPINGQVRLLPDGPNPEAASYDCSSGFQLIGAKERKCIGKSWSGRPPICQYLPSMTINKTSVTYSILTTQETSQVSIHSIGFTFSENHVSSKSNTTAETTKPFWGIFGIESITIIVLATALAISIFITIFLCQRRNRPVQSNVVNTGNSRYEVPDATLIRLMNLDILPDRESYINERISERDDLQHRTIQKDDHYYEEIENIVS